MDTSVPHELWDYLSLSQLSLQAAQGNNRCLGALCFSEDIASAPSRRLNELPCECVPMRRLDADGPLCETWYGSGQITPGQHGAIRYRHDEQVLYGVIVASETAFELDAGKTPLQQATEWAYRQIFALSNNLGFRHLLRVWSYMGSINLNSFGLERYKQFNLGRQDAFQVHGLKAAQHAPAASALGSTHGPLTVAFLAGCAAPHHIENPRQVSAYRYPRQYGPKSPMFSRATLVPFRHQEALFVSGTASIVGHSTIHPGDAKAQTRETVANIKAVVAEANQLVAGDPFQLSDLSYKVYLRDPAVLEDVRAELTNIVGGGLKAVYLQADICRQDLILEIEAIAGQPLSHSTQGHT